MEINFSTKAGTIVSLEKYIKKAKIPKSFFFTVKEWEKNYKNIKEKIINDFGESSLIVRSSCKKEDKINYSNSGAFLSVQHVKKNVLEDSINKVIKSYKRTEEEDEVLIQPMLKNVISSGVAFSHDPNTFSPYRIINWTEGSDTTTVTSGVGGKVWQQAAKSPYKPPKKISRILDLVEELLTIFKNVPIDCEFAITEEKNKSILWLLQVRPLVLRNPPENECDQEKRLELITKKIEKGMQPQTFLMGRRTVYGVMPDWNPAEILGIRPKPLALSLYRELITDSIWAYQRHNYGYRNLRSFPLITHFFGLPYVDVRLSLNSFIPRDLNDKISGKLVDYYIDRLLDQPTLHDKVEFEIVYSCYTLDLPNRLKNLDKVHFSLSDQKEIALSLRNLTNRIIDYENGLWKNDVKKIEILKERRNHLLNSTSNLIERVYWLLEDTKRYGTLPFAGLARAGFIAVQMLQSFVSVGVFSKDDYESFMASLSTVSGQLSRDKFKLDKKTFLSKYGHLRPGTYDILSPRYDEAEDYYFDWTKKHVEIERQEQFSLTLSQMKEITSLLKSHHLSTDAVSLLDFLQTAIEMREMSKFQFTRNLSDSLSLIASIAENYGITREEIAFADIRAFKELHITTVDPKSLLLSTIDEGKKRYEETLKISLPPLISSPQDVWGFQWPNSEPNFITQKQITADVIKYNSFDDIDINKLEGSIICIPSADPGFDWLFSYQIQGLITAWGGVNSHMAIRAGELGMPSVIGAGELLYKRWSNAKRLHLDCCSRKVVILE